MRERGREEGREGERGRGREEGRRVRGLTFAVSPFGWQPPREA